MPTALFNRGRGRESATSRRYSIRRAAGGSSLMARTATSRRRRLPRGDDRISALPDDLLLLILRRLDIQTAVGTGTLSRRWACLRRELPVLNLSVHAMLPPRYHRWVQLHGDIVMPSFQYDMHQLSRELLPNIRRYEQRAMREFTRSVESFLESAHRRRISRLRLEFFVTNSHSHSTACMNQLIAEAMDVCGVDHLQVVAKPIYWRRGAVHIFSSHGGLCKDPSASRLQSLKLGGCVLPPLLHEYGALTKLVLQDIPESTPVATYEGVFSLCRQLQVLHLISCRCRDNKAIFADAPMSRIRELVVDGCRFRPLRLRALPNLESLASLGPRVFLESASFPCLRKFNLTASLGVTGLREFLKKNLRKDHESLFKYIPDVTHLIVRISGPDRWIMPSSRSSPLTTLLPNLRRLLVADVPSSWDVSWPRLLLETAPSLEVLHIHIATCLEEPARDDEIPWKPTMLRHRHLEEFMMVGYGATGRQIYLVNFVIGACTALRHVSIFKNGHARNKGHWDWELVTQQHSWTDEEKDNTRMHIMDGVSLSAAPVQLVFG